MAPQTRECAVRLDALPPAVLRLILAELPVDSRARCCAVCRAFRDVLASPAMWDCLDFSRADGVADERLTEWLILGAAGRAAGQLRVLNLDRILNPQLTDLIQDIVDDNAATLREINTGYVAQDAAYFRTLLEAAPGLTSLTAWLDDSAAALAPVLRGDAPYAPLRAQYVGLGLGHATREHCAAVAAALAQHASLKRLAVYGAQGGLTIDGLTAVLEAAAARRPSVFEFTTSAFFPRNGPALARLLQGGSVVTLSFSMLQFPHGPQRQNTVLQLFAALRGCTSVTDLQLQNMMGTQQWGIASIMAQPYCGALMDALAQLPALTALDLSWNPVPNNADADRVAAGTALGALLASDPPALRSLDITYMRLGDAGLEPLLEGLARNTHLRALECRHNDGQLLEGRLMQAQLEIAGRALNLAGDDDV
jgi:hypothetical protein